MSSVTPVPTSFLFLHSANWLRYSRRGCAATVRTVAEAGKLKATLDPGVVLPVVKADLTSRDGSFLHCHKHAALLNVGLCCSKRRKRRRLKSSLSFDRSSRSIQRGKAETQNMSKIGLKTEAGEVKSYGMIEYCASIFDKTNGQNTRNMIGTAAKADTCVPQSCEALG